MAKQIHVIHGIRAKDRGAQSMGKLTTLLSHHFSKLYPVSYGYVLVPLSNKKARDAIVKSLEKYKNKNDEVIVIGYSNGCWAAVQAAEMGYKIDHMVLISPALYRSHAIPEQVKRVDVYYSEGDLIVELGGLYKRLVNLLPWNWKIFGTPHDWGQMGKYGYQGNDPRIHNWNMGNDISHFWYKNKMIVRRIADKVISLYENEEVTK